MVSAATRLLRKFAGREATIETMGGMISESDIAGGMMSKSETMPPQAEDRLLEAPEEQSVLDLVEVEAAKEDTPTLDESRSQDDDIRDEEPPPRFRFGRGYDMYAASLKQLEIEVPTSAPTKKGSSLMRKMSTIVSKMTRTRSTDEDAKENSDIRTVPVAQTKLNSNKVDIAHEQSQLAESNDSHAETDPAHVLIPRTAKEDFVGAPKENEAAAVGTEPPAVAELDDAGSVEIAVGDVKPSKKHQAAATPSKTQKGRKVRPSRKNKYKFNKDETTERTISDDEWDNPDRDMEELANEVSTNLSNIIKTFSSDNTEAKELKKPWWQQRWWHCW